MKTTVVHTVLPEAVGDENSKNADHQGKDAEPPHGDDNEGCRDNRANRFTFNLNSPNPVDVIFARLVGRPNGFTHIDVRVQDIGDFERLQLLTVYFPIMVADHIATQSSRFFVQPAIDDFHFLH
ncbi:hypothetical protein D3C84_963230 [compost metagenome]